MRQDPQIFLRDTLWSFCHFFLNNRLPHHTTWGKELFPTTKLVQCKYANPALLPACLHHTGLTATLLLPFSILICGSNAAGGRLGRRDTGPLYYLLVDGEQDALLSPAANPDNFYMWSWYLIAHCLGQALIMENNWINNNAKCLNICPYMYVSQGRDLSCLHCSVRCHVQ